MKKFTHILKKEAIYVVLLILFIFFACANKRFLSTNNLLNIARQVAVLGIASVGMTYVILIGGFILNKTYFGRYFYAIGGNETASQLSAYGLKE